MRLELNPETMRIQHTWPSRIQQVLAAHPDGLVRGEIESKLRVASRDQRGIRNLRRDLREYEVLSAPSLKVINTDK
jgi:hypothetical protein